VGLLGSDVERARELTTESVERSHSVGFTWCEAFAASFDGIVRGAAGDAEGALERYSAALEVQQRIGDLEGAGLSLSGLAALAAGRGDLAGAIELYGRSLAAFEAIGDRAEEARILSELAWTHLRDGDPAAARWRFLETVRAYDDVASVRGVGLALIGLAATEAVEARPGTAVQIAAAAEVYAREEGIVNAYGEQDQGRQYLDNARAALSADEIAQATAAGERLSMREALEIARSPAAV
jgi:hypothetical protein